MAPQFEAQRPEGVQVIQGYDARGWRVSGDVPGASVIVTPERAVSCAATDVASLTAEDCAPVLAAEPPIDVLLIGTGASMIRPPKSTLEALRAKGLSPEFMDSRAAARTYNVLVAEGRRVAAVLLPL